MKVLPFCAVCGKVKDSFVHDIDFKNAPNYDYHEFKPCVTLEDAKEVLKLKDERIKFYESQIALDEEIELEELGCLGGLK